MVDVAQEQKGAVLFAESCQTCHGPNAVGGKKDLRYMTPEVHADFLNIVRGGERAEKGMPDLSAQVSKEQAEDIHAYLIQRAQEDWPPHFLRQGWPGRGERNIHRHPPPFSGVRGPPHPP